MTASRPSSGPPTYSAGGSPGDQVLVQEVFGDRLGMVRRFADTLATVGAARGLIGPREVGHLWQRHLLNCAFVTDLLPEGSRVVDVGTGAGLPGLVLALRRPDLHVVLVDPMLRRTTFLLEVVTALGIEEQVQVVRGRAEDPATVTTVGPSMWVVARAVAPLDRLVSWCLPLLAPGGTLLAMKGARVDAEIETARTAIGRMGGKLSGVTEVGVGESTTRVVRISRPTMSGPSRRNG